MGAGVVALLLAAKASHRRSYRGPICEEICLRQKTGTASFSLLTAPAILYGILPVYTYLFLRFPLPEPEGTCAACQQDGCRGNPWQGAAGRFLRVDLFGLRLIDAGDGLLDTFISQL